MPVGDTTRMRHYIMESVDEATAPGKMTPQEAIEFLQELSADVDGRIEALKDENDLE